MIRTRWKRSNQVITNNNIGITYSNIISGIFTNCNIPIKELKPNKRLRIIASLHEGANGDKFIHGVDCYKSMGIRVDVDLLDSKIFGLNIPGDRKPGGGTVDKGVIKPGTYSWKECLEYPVFNYGPDGKLVTSPGQTWYEYVHDEIRKDIIWNVE